MEKNLALVVGGSNGIGLALVEKLISENYKKIVCFDKTPLPKDYDNVEFIKLNLRDLDIHVFDEFTDADSLIITAGFGRAAEFNTFTDEEIKLIFNVNCRSIIQIIRYFYTRLLSKEDFHCAVMGSIAGLVSSPMFSVYSATKAALCRFIESINIELEMNGSANRILNISPGSLKGTKFNGGENNLDLLSQLSGEILTRMYAREELFIPQYEETYKSVIERYQKDPHKFGVESYDYKLKSGRLNNTPQVKIGYLSGTFDLFHIGHLNLLKRAKEYCDYLVVGVHKDASHKGKTTFISFEERAEIVRSIKYVDEVVESMPEDTDIYNELKYHYLFVGSDYKGTERFNKYEEFFRNKDTEIIYFPYTQGTSSSSLRTALNKLNERN